MIPIPYARFQIENHGYSTNQYGNAFIELQIFQDNTRSHPIKKYDIKGCLSKQITQAIQM